jgi:hypothetical protein
VNCCDAQFPTYVPLPLDVVSLLAFELDELGPVTFLSCSNPQPVVNRTTARSETTRAVAVLILRSVIVFAITLHLVRITESVRPTTIL